MSLELTFWYSNKEKKCSIFQCCTKEHCRENGNENVLIKRFLQDLQHKKYYELCRDDVVTNSATFKCCEFEFEFEELPPPLVLGAYCLVHRQHVKHVSF